MTRPRRWHRLIRKIPGQTYLWLAILIFGASSAVTRKLTEIGAQHFIGGRNPISLCNVLFVGNLCALIVLIMIYGRQWNKANLKQISRQEWLALTVVAILSGAAAPGLVFRALELTEVNNIILVGRLEPPLIMALSVWLLRERVGFWEVVGAIAAFVGVTLTIILQSPGADMMNMAGLKVGIGELLAAVAALISVASTILVKRYLSDIPLGIFNIFRTALGSGIFFFIALVFYGKHHFMEVFSPFLWQWMLVYGVVIVVIGQSFWLKGLRYCTVSAASLVGSFTPIVGIIAAYLILGEAPTLAQYVGGSLILVGIFLSQVGIRRQSSRRDAQSLVSSAQVEHQIEAGMGFKGI
ncbi:DMT(drug/metabolite transporter) superfamily permease [Cylindrospermum stagnale PCC 7417]|uniref:DMT(Drug/metabolite transporter) superfamily permease n=1 Tax=Cylindrospermum stagnale PCC 7417 TaxID=56107 RepID=K9WR82_9NOST|nr:DMT family transporter [Cylindrospermum stagnale]AFZ22693.1 DMT(drug/metabolite transporter) superfamily permease [Cylindrospermum stagnale PCC 7417]